MPKSQDSKFLNTLGDLMVEILCSIFYNYLMASRGEKIPTASCQRIGKAAVGGNVLVQKVNWHWGQ